MDTPNVLLIAVDTLRADHLGCYGYHRATSPRIDAFAKEGAVFDRFFCAGLPTHPSFTTLYTGQHPVTHGVVAHVGRNDLDRDAPCLPRTFLQNGYVTCAVDNLLQHRTWFGRGYEFYIDPSQRKTLALDVDCEELNARAIPWLRQNKDDPFFLFIHYWDPHWPLRPPARYRDLFYEGNPFDPNNHSLDGWWKNSLGALARETWLRYEEGAVTDAGYVEALYDQEIRHLDDGIHELLSTLDELGLTDDTLVVFLGDHGESFTEHGIYVEHRGLYESTLHVPLIARWPGHIPAGQRLSPMAQHQDVAPTILEAAGIEIPEDMTGESVWPLLSGQSKTGGRDRIVSCECTWQAKWCLRTDRYKFILARETDRYGTPNRELYDLVVDPGELQNLAEESPKLARQMEEELEQWIRDRLAESGKTEDPLVQHGVGLTWL